MITEPAYPALSFEWDVRDWNNHVIIGPQEVSGSMSKENKDTASTSFNSKRDTGDYLNMKDAFRQFAPERRNYFRRFSDVVAQQNIEVIKTAAWLTLVMLLIFMTIAYAVIPEWEVTPYHIAMLVCMALFCVFGFVFPKKWKTDIRYALTFSALYLISMVTCAIGIDLSSVNDGPAVILPVLYVAFSCILVLPAYIDMPIFCIAEIIYIILVIQTKSVFMAGMDIFSTLFGLAIAVVTGYMTAIVNMRTNTKFQQFRRLSELDQLTGLTNKASGKKLIEEYISNRADSEYCALIMPDVDDFKQFNDLYGHQSGDEVLKKIGKVLLDNFRATDILTRFGGDEFLILLKDMQNENLVRLKCDDIRRGVKSIRLMTADAEVSVSIGAAWIGKDSIELGEFFQAADDALYFAKLGGKSNFIIEKAKDNHKKPIMLVIDDDSISRKLMHSAFNDDYAVIEAESGSKGLDVIHKYSRRIDIVVLDIVMPGMSGFEVLQDIRSSFDYRTLPVVVVTADPESEKKALEMGANDMISKPYTVDVLKLRIKNVVHNIEKQ